MILFHKIYVVCKIGSFITEHIQTHLLNKQLRTYRVSFRSRDAVILVRIPLIFRRESWASKHGVNHT